MEHTKDIGETTTWISRRTTVRLAWSLWTICIALTALSLLLLVLIRSYPNVPVFDWWAGNALVVVDATVGALIASRRPENPVGWLLCLSGVAVGTSSFTSQYAIYALLARSGSPPGGEAMAWVAAWLLPVMLGLQVSTFALFPTGRSLSRRWRWLVWLTAAFACVGAVLAAFSSDAHLGSLGPIRNPLGIAGFSGVYEAVLFSVGPLLFAGAALSVFVRLRRATGMERQQIKWFAYAVAIYAISVVINVINLAIDTPPWFELGGTVFFTVAGTIIIISIGIAILRYRLYDIDRIINRTLIYGALTVTLVAVYFGSIVSLQYAFRALTGSGSQLAVVASTLAIAALFNPLRRSIQSFVDRRFYRDKYDAKRILDTFSIKLRDETDLEDLSSELVGVLHDTVRPERVSLWLRPQQRSSGKAVE